MTEGYFIKVSKNSAKMYSMGNLRVYFVNVTCWVLVWVNCVYIKKDTKLKPLGS